LTLDKYLSKTQVVDKPTGIAEAPIAKTLVPTDIANKFLLSDTSPPQKVRDTRQQSKIVCLYPEPCPDKEGQFCYFRGKYCSQQKRDKV
jgi:hypothetical protein